MSKNTWQVGDVIVFGEYPNHLVEDWEIIYQLNKIEPNLDNVVLLNNKKYAKYADKYYEFKELKWIVLGKSNGATRLLSENVIDVFSREEQRPKPNEYGLRRYLNAVFVRMAFSEEERVRMTMDKDLNIVYLPSKKDIDNCGLIEAPATEWANRTEKIDSYWIKETVAGGKYGPFYGNKYDYNAKDVITVQNRLGGGTNIFGEEIPKTHPSGIRPIINIKGGKQ